MAEDLKTLSDRATAGEWWLGEEKGGYRYLNANGDRTKTGIDRNVPWAGFARFIVEMEDGLSCSGGANVEFAVALVNAYRSGQLYDATALAEAEARGRRLGLEEAAKVVDERAAICAAAAAQWIAPEDGDGIDQEMAACMHAAEGQCRQAAEAIRKLLATAPAETQKPETGDAGR